jgi:hypothetical protein
VQSTSRSNLNFPGAPRLGLRPQPRSVHLRKSAASAVKQYFHMDQPRFIAKHIVNLPKSGIRD